MLDNNKIHYKLFKGNVLNEYQSITKDGTPFKVFSPFWRHAEQIYLDKVPSDSSKIQKLSLKNIFNSKILLSIFYQRKIGLKSLINIGGHLKMKHIKT